MSVRYCRPSVSQSVIQSVNLSFLDSLCANLCWLILLGIVRWGTQIQRIIDDGDLLLQQTRTQDITSPITVLLEGEHPKYGEKKQTKEKKSTQELCETTRRWNDRIQQSCLKTLSLAGPVGCGKTALAVHLALKSDFPFIKLCTPENMIGFVESAKCQTIKKVRISLMLLWGLVQPILKTKNGLEDFWWILSNS